MALYRLLLQAEMYCEQGLPEQMGRIAAPLGIRVEAESPIEAIHRVEHAIEGLIETQPMPLIEVAPNPSDRPEPRTAYQHLLEEETPPTGV